MKKCPECRRDYYDDSLLYCLDDGVALLEGPGRSGELPTEVIPTSNLYGDRPPLLGMDADEIAKTSNAIAVLPFANLSRNEDTEYFSDGLAEELLSVLSRIRGLRVVARTSAFSFKGKQMSIEEIGRSLRVGAVLEGSVRIADDRVRIAVRLVDVEEGYHLWSETYDRTMEDIFAIQDDIARSVVGQLRLGESLRNANSQEIAKEVGRAVKGRAADAEAYRLLLIGRHLLERGNQDDVKTAMKHFRRAIEIDPNYALCWAELGRAHQIESGQLWNAFEAGYEQAEALSRRALEIEPDLAEGYAVLGYVHQMRRFDFVQAERCFRRALDLAPENPYVLRRMGTLARELGRFDEALQYYSRAVSIDPLSPCNWWQAGLGHFFADELAKAESAFRRALELGSQAVFVHAFLALVLLMQGRSDEALAEAFLEPDERYWRPWALAIIHNAGGRDDESRAELARLDADETPFQIAEVHSMRGETGDAFDWLERTIARHDPARILMKVSPFLRSLHRDPRWLPLLRKIGFPDGDQILYETMP